MKLLHYMNVGKVPFMIVLTVFNFFTWAGSLLTTVSPHINKLGNWSVLILIPLAIVAIILTHYATILLVSFLKKTGYHGDVVIDFIGREGLMQSLIRQLMNLKRFKNNVKRLLLDSPN